MVTAKKFVLVQHFEGEPKPSDFQLVTEELPSIEEGQFLVEADFLSVDPYMRVYTSDHPLGDTMIGGQVGRVIETKHPDWKIGEFVVGNFGWRTHTIVDPQKPAPFNMSPYKLPDLGNLSPSLGLGVLGMPGNTAYFGFLELCQPKEGETVVVSGAAGAVGSLVGQIAKIKGCRVIGFAGSDEKCKWLTQTLGFDAAFNYKTKDISESLKEAAPKGVDCYFDNVGGELSGAVLNHMNHRGRVSVCGSISAYNADMKNYPKANVVQPALVFKELKMEGFLAIRWWDRWMEGINQNLNWVREGKIKHAETITRGFENMPEAFIGMLQGLNMGKAIVMV